MLTVNEALNYCIGNVNLLHGKTAFLFGGMIAVAVATGYFIGHTIDQEKRLTKLEKLVKASPEA